MKNIGFLMITIGFLAGSYLAVQTAENAIPWNWFVPALIVGTVGVGLARTGTRQAATDAGAVSANIENIDRSIGNVVTNIIALDDQKESFHPFEVHTRIDELFPEDLTTFVEARESIGHVYGLQAYAEVMNEFAAGERYLNRVWSASVDCYVDEVREYLGRARTQFEITAAKVAALKNG